MRNIYANQNYIFQREIANHRLVPVVEDFEKQEKIIFLSFDKICNYFIQRNNHGYAICIVTSDRFYYYPLLCFDESQALKTMKHIALIGVGNLKLTIMDWLSVYRGFAEDMINVII